MIMLQSCANLIYKLKLPHLLLAPRSRFVARLARGEQSTRPTIGCERANERLFQLALLIEWPARGADVITSRRPLIVAARAQRGGGGGGGGGEEVSRRKGEREKSRPKCSPTN